MNFSSMIYIAKVNKTEPTANSVLKEFYYDVVADVLYIQLYYSKLIHED